MLKRGRQKKHFNKAWHSMLAHLLAFCETQKQEELHRFRVQVKKIKALLRFSQGSSSAQHLKPLQSIFKQAGKIRGAHIHLHLIEQYQLANAELKNRQEKIEKDETRRFCLRYNVHTKSLQRTEKTIFSNFQDIKNKVIVRLYKKRLKKLARSFAQPTDHTANLHKNRKEVKMLLYFHAMLPKLLVKKLRLNTSYLDRLQDAIGQWHDIISIAALLEKERFTDKKMLAKLARQSSRLYAAILVLSRDFKNKVAQ